jgi:hypothetical protein
MRFHSDAKEQVKAVSSRLVFQIQTLPSVAGFHNTRPKTNDRFPLAIASQCKWRIENSVALCQQEPRRTFTCLDTQTYDGALMSEK